MGNSKTNSSKDILITNFEVKSSIKLLIIPILIVSILIMGLAPFVSAQNEKPVMAIDMRHGSLPELEKIALDKGWSVLRLDEPVTFKLLGEKKVSLFVISDISFGYTDQELEELKAYVAGNGNIAIEMPENSYHTEPMKRKQLTRELTRQFGIDILDVETQTVGMPYNELIVSDFPTHPLFEGVSKISIKTLYTYFYLTVEPPAEVLLPHPRIASPYNSLMALFKDESGGRVIVYSKDMHAEKADNTLVLTNILNWIAPPGIEPPKPHIVTNIKEVIDPKSYWILGIGIALIIIAIIVGVTFIKKSKKLKKG